MVLLLSVCSVWFPLQVFLEQGSDHSTVSQMWANQTATGNVDPICLTMRQHSKFEHVNTHRMSWNKCCMLWNTHRTMARGVSSESQLPVIYGLVIVSAVQGLQVPLTLLGTGIDPHPLLQLPECLINGNQLVCRQLILMNFGLWTTFQLLFLRLSCLSGSYGLLGSPTDRSL